MAYEEVLEELVGEVSGTELPELLSSLAAALNADDSRRRILIVELAHLLDEGPSDLEGARKSALIAAIAGLLGSCAEVPAEDPRLAFAAALWSR